MAKAMTKTQLVAEMADRMAVDKKTAGSALEALSEIIRREVSDGGAVTIPDVGKISCRARPERTVRNPGTGESLVKPADRAVKVTVAKALKDCVNA